VEDAGASIEGGGNLFVRRYSTCDTSPVVSQNLIRVFGLQKTCWQQRVSRRFPAGFELVSTVVEQSVADMPRESVP
jgi:hypothetical protein